MGWDCGVLILGKLKRRWCSFFCSGCLSDRIQGRMRVTGFGRVSEWDGEREGGGNWAWVWVDVWLAGWSIIGLIRCWGWSWSWNCLDARPWIGRVYFLGYLLLYVFSSHHYLLWRRFAGMRILYIHPRRQSRWNSTWSDWQAVCTQLGNWGLSSQEVRSWALWAC